MNADRAIERLEEHQNQIRRVLLAVEPHLRNGNASHFKALALARWALMRALREYQLFKHAEIFDPIIEAGAGIRTAAASMLKARCIDVAEAYAEHVKRWSLDGPARDWAGYRREAMSFASSIQDHLQAEMRDVRALLDGLNSTRKCSAL